MYVLSAAQMREADRQTISGDAGGPPVPGITLMRNAAAAVVELVSARYAAELRAPVLVLAGGGNNGGDGLLAALILRERGVAIEVALLGDPARLRGDAARALSDLRALASNALSTIASESDWARWRDRHLPRGGLLLDAIFGVGLMRPVEGLYRQVIEDVNGRFTGVVVAVDLPSGLAADGSLPSPTPTAEAAVIRAHATVTFTAPKRGHFLDPRAAATGHLRVAAIGTPPALLDEDDPGARLVTARDCRPYLQARRRDAHKGNFGHVLVVGGSVGKSGAVALAGSAALRMGAGLVTAAVPRSILPTVAATRPELMTEPLEENGEGGLAQLTEPRRAELLRAATVLAIGPGLGASASARETARALVKAAAVPCILDADGLNAYAGRRAELRAGPAGLALTPHPGEMARLFEVPTATVTGRPLYYAQRLAGESGAVVVLKGHRTLTAAPDGGFYINASGNPGMATGGAGDVLTGFTAGLVAQFSGAPLAVTVAAAVYLHGRAGDAAAAAGGEMTLLAGDLIEYLSAALLAVRREAEAPELPYDVPE